MVVVVARAVVSYLRPIPGFAAALRPRNRCHVCSQDRPDCTWGRVCICKPGARIGASWRIEGGVGRSGRSGVTDCSTPTFGRAAASAASGGATVLGPPDLTGSVPMPGVWTPVAVALGLDRRPRRPAAATPAAAATAPAVRLVRAGTGGSAVVAGAADLAFVLKPALANTSAAAWLCCSVDFFSFALSAAICWLVRRARGRLSRPLPMIDGAGAVAVRVELAWLLLKLAGKVSWQCQPLQLTIGRLAGF